MTLVGKLFARSPRGETSLKAMLAISGLTGLALTVGVTGALAQDAAPVASPAADATASTEPVDEPGPVEAVADEPEMTPYETLTDEEPLPDEPPLPPPPPPAAPPPSPGSVIHRSGTDIPIDFQLHGYFRARVGVWDSMPIANPDREVGSNRDGATDVAFAHMRLRLEPTISFGSNRYQPVAALRAQLDMLDNVVLGDNNRQASTPIFSNDPSNTSLFSGANWGSETSPIFLRRLWLEFMTPIGQIRVGRQGSHGGLGLLFNDGGTGPYGIAPDASFRNDFGDALAGTTFDRIIFLTRPLNIVNTLGSTHIAERRGPDGLPTTPLVLGLAYDWLAEDTRGVGGMPQPRSNVPFGFVSGSDYSPTGSMPLAGADDVWQTTLILAWSDPDFNMEVNARDDLMAGLVLVHRGQQRTRSDIWIGDLFYRVRYSAFGRSGPQIYSEGEIYTIQGTSNGVSLTGDFCETPDGCDFNEDGSPDPGSYGTTASQLGANIWGGADRIGLEDQLWTVSVEAGFSTGQAGASLLGNTLFTQRPSNPNYQMGMLLYPVVLNVRTANAYDFSTAVWSNGGVWNSAYLAPQVRVRPLGQNGGLELIGQFIVAFADQLNGPLNRQAGGATGSCPALVSSNCFLGWEADVAVKVSWGPHDEMRWSNEFGVMGVGDAIGGFDASRTDALGNNTWGRLTDPILWTLQSRIAFVF